jgi:hypothetical protein
VGRQWLLLDRKATLLGARSFPNSGSGFPSKIVFFSARHILAETDSGNGVSVEEFRTAGG